MPSHLFSPFTQRSLTFRNRIVVAPMCQYSAVDRFAAHQKAGEAVVLHFHADWCPVCRAQSKVLNGWQGDAAVPGTVLVVNYDKERDLKRQLGVRTQSTLIAYKGTAEKARLAGETDASALRTLLDSVK